MAIASRAAAEIKPGARYDRLIAVDAVAM